MQVAMARVMPCDHTAWLSVHQACVVPNRLPQGFGFQDSRSSLSPWPHRGSPKLRSHMPA